MKITSKKMSAQKQRHEKHYLKRLKLDFAPLNLEHLDQWDAWRLSCRFPDGLYRDKSFICKDCGAAGIWKAWQQKWWFEQMQGNPDSGAARCRACRVKERQRKTEARRISAEGLARKRARQAQNNP
ncbi:hypothetical protein AGMMS49545_06890 [Betaproteobacteria bacterium]|nr:hypothetical protein AGMMS49545_06890 [Betaproteobacteria bacterium]